MKKKMMFLVIGLFLCAGFSCDGPIDELEEMEIFEVPSSDDEDDEKDSPIGKESSNNGV